MSISFSEGWSSHHWGDKQKGKYSCHLLLRNTLQPMTALIQWRNPKSMKQNSREKRYMYKIGTKKCFQQYIYIFFSQRNLFCSSQLSDAHLSWFFPKTHKSLICQLHELAYQRLSTRVQQGERAWRIQQTDKGAKEVNWSYRERLMGEWNAGVGLKRKLRWGEGSDCRWKWQDLWVRGKGPGHVVNRWRMETK